MRIGELLIEKNLIQPEQVDEALRAQVLYGGRLGTNLVELGHLNLDALTDALGEQHGLAAALQRHFDTADRALQQRMPAALAAELAAVPLAYAMPNNQSVAVVAFIVPPDEATLARVGEALGCEIVAAIAAELRLRYQLECVYRIPRPNRYLRISRAPAPEPDRRRYVKPLSAPDALEATGAPTLGRIAIARRRMITGSEDEAHPPRTLDEALREIRRAVDRDRVVDIIEAQLRDGLGGALGAGIILLVREEMAIGWRGFSRGAPEEGDALVGDIAIPMSEPSALQLSYRTGYMVAGTPPPAGELIDRRLWALLGCERPPAEVVVAPVTIQERVVCLLYGHAADYGPMNPDVVNGVSALAEAAGAAFARLIKASQR